MSGILDRFPVDQRFVVGNTDEYFALQLAKRLGDEPGIRRYIQYVERHSEDRLLRALHQALRSSDPARTFHSSLVTETP
jgi:hypothetical protein